MNYQFKEKLQEILKQDERFYTKDEDRFFKNKITECASNLDTKLIELLLNDSECVEKFFKTYNAGGNEVTIFDRESFNYWINHQEFLPNSYTKFKQNIGLSIDGNTLLRQSKNVSLIFPYKDCVLQGGQTKEDAKRNEIFYNEVLAPDQIDRLLDKKVLCNFKRLRNNGEEKLRNIENITRENLIIKGNNLLALHCLKHKYRKKVKLIYIDPPYNTGGDANIFSYNNSFNHSTWYVFMKNRLEIAKEFLRDDGFIAIAIDHYELGYLIVLADEIFGRENRLGIITVVHNPGGRQDDKFFPTANEFMLIYAKNIHNARIFTLGESAKKLKQFKNTDMYGKYKLRGFRRGGNNSNREDGEGLYYSIYYNPQTDHISLDKKDGYLEILPINDKGVEKCWRWSPETFIEKKDKYIQILKINNKWDVYVKERESDYIGEKAKTFWHNSRYTGQTGTSILKKIFGDKIFAYPKSLYTVLDTLKIMTSEALSKIEFFSWRRSVSQCVWA